MGYWLTTLVLAAVCTAAAMRFRRAERHAAAARQKAERERLEREARESELRDRFLRARRKADALESAKNAIRADPARAARVVSNMMKDKGVL